MGDANMALLAALLGATPGDRRSENARRLGAAWISPNDLSGGAADLLLGSNPLQDGPVQDPGPTLTPLDQIPPEKRTLWMSGSGNPLANKNLDTALADARARAQLDGVIPPNAQNLGRGGQAPFAFNDLSAISQPTVATADPRDDIPMEQRVDHAVRAAIKSSRHPSSTGIGVQAILGGEAAPSGEPLATGLRGYGQLPPANPASLANMVRQARAANMAQAPGPADAAPPALPPISLGGLSPEQQDQGRKFAAYQDRQATQSAASHDFLVQRARQKAIQRKGELAGLDSPEAFYNAQQGSLLNSLLGGGGGGAMGQGGQMNPAIAGMLGGEGAFIAALNQGPKAQEMALQAQLAHDQLASHERMGSASNDVKREQIAMEGKKYQEITNPDSTLLKPDERRELAISQGKFDHPSVQSVLEGAFGTPEEKAKWQGGMFTGGHDQDRFAAYVAGKYGVPYSVAQNWFVHRSAGFDPRGAKVGNPQAIHDYNPKRDRGLGGK